MIQSLWCLFPHNFFLSTGWHTVPKYGNYFLCTVPCVLSYLICHCKGPVLQLNTSSYHPAQWLPHMSVSKSAFHWTPYAFLPGVQLNSLCLPSVLHLSHFFGIEYHLGYQEHSSHLHYWSPGSSSGALLILYLPFSPVPQSLWPSKRPCTYELFNTHLLLAPTLGGDALSFSLASIT